MPKTSTEHPMFDFTPMAAEHVLQSERLTRAVDEPAVRLGSIPGSAPVRAAQNGSDIGSTVHQGSASLMECERAVDEGSTETSHRTPSVTAGRDRHSEWREVPQALFLSWPDAAQDTYCAARDRDSAKTAAERGEDPEFYLQRARMYAARV